MEILDQLLREILVQTGTAIFDRYRFELYTTQKAFVIIFMIQ
jgi:hypothetical protein